VTEIRPHDTINFQYIIHVKGCLNTTIAIAKPLSIDLFIVYRKPFESVIKMLYRMNAL
jgi:hypothetical protein